MTNSIKLLKMADECEVDVLELYRLLKLTPLALYAILWGGSAISCKTAIELECIFFGVAEDWVPEDRYPELLQIKLKDSRFKTLTNGK